MNNENNNQDLNSLYGNPAPTNVENPQPTEPVSSSQSMNELYGNPTTPQPVPEQPQMINESIQEQPQMTSEPIMDPAAAQPEQPVQAEQPAEPTVQPNPQENQPQEPSQPAENKNPNAVDEKLVEAFVGPAYQAFVKGQFNPGAFFLTSLYFFYRKMFLYGLAFFVGQILLSMILGKAYIAILINIACALTANKIYLNFAKTKVKKLSKTTPQEQLLSKCEEKGGTSVGLVFLGMFVEFILLLVVIVIAMFVFGAALFASILGGLSQEAISDSYRAPTMVSTFKTYSNAVKTAAIADSISCNNKDIESLGDGTYYVELDSSSGYSDAQTNAKLLVGEGGKSSWGNADIKGYVKIQKEGRGYKTFINLSDNTHGTKQEVSDETISQNDISNDVSFPTTPSGIKCTVTE